MYLRSVVSIAAAAAAVAGLSGVSPARAQDQTPPAAPAADQAPAHPVWEGIQFSGHIEAGATVTNNDPSNNINFGQAFTDRADAFRVNQTMLTAEHDLDPKATGIDLGFKLQGMYGTDARYTHFLGELDRATRSPYQWDIIEANGQAHLPIIGAGGMDLKIGQYSTPLGYEVIDATGNPLYSHSYIFNYGLPFKHSGGITTTHVNDTLDIWAGVDTGVNTSFGHAGDNNSSISFLYGVGLNNLLDGNLTVLALSHVGPENPRGTVYANLKPVAVNRYSRQFYDAVITYKFNDSLSEATELNYVKEDAFGASAGGAAQYVTYTLNDQWSITGRAEAFADQGKANGWFGFVCADPGSEDVIDSERNITNNGAAPTVYCGTGNNGTAGLKNYNLTYGELTIGASYKPPISLPSTASLTIRPELRYDDIIGGGSEKPFNIGPNGQGRSTGAFTAAVDFILGF
jgi:hypothetical protein